MSHFKTAFHLAGVPLHFRIRDTDRNLIPGDEPGLQKAFYKLLDFWAWWDDDPDSDFKIDRSKVMCIANDIAERCMPVQRTFDLYTVKLLVDGTRILAFDNASWHKDKCTQVFNDAMLGLSADPTAYPIIEAELSENAIDKLVNLARLFV